MAKRLTCVAYASRATRQRQCCAYGRSPASFLSSLVQRPIIWPASAGRRNGTTTGRAGRPRRQSTGSVSLIFRRVHGNGRGYDYRQTDAAGSKGSRSFEMKGEKRNEKTISIRFSTVKIVRDDVEPQ